MCTPVGIGHVPEGNSPFSEEREGGVTMSVRVQALLVGLAAIAAAALNAGFPWD